MSDDLHPGQRLRPELLEGIAPVFRVDPVTRDAHLIGTGFWVSEFGHLVTAWHVVAENIGPDGVDRGPIFAIQTFSDRSFVARTFVKTDKHPQFDLALSETCVAAPDHDRSTIPLTMTLDEVKSGDPVFSFAVLDGNQEFDSEKWPGTTTARFRSELTIREMDVDTSLQFAARQSFGFVSEIFETLRDTVMLPFPCVQTDVPIYGANSGGPLFDHLGKVCAVHCTSYEGADIAFHVPIRGVLELRLRAESIKLTDHERKQWSLLELAFAEIVPFDPPLLDVRRLFWSALRWLKYAIKRKFSGQSLSKNIHLVEARPAPKND
ncbi:MAG: serine protease [Proteobacteria bacterium]|nr:serine protease [Pseudomonadota bacterium]